MIDRDFVTKGRSVTHLKDLDNALDAAHRLGLSALPYTEATAELFRGLLANAGDLDHAGLLVELERRNDIRTDRDAANGQERETAAAQ
jgi:2-hydroxy-3-oxopropionate reductase